MSKFYEQIKENIEPYIIAEIGANHNGDMNLAKRIIDSAKECGADSVKFQSWDNQSIVSRAEYEANAVYNDSKKKHFGSLKEMVDKYYLRPEQHFELKKYCDECKIDFCSSHFSIEEIDLLNKVDVPFFKSASMDINNIPLLKYVAKFNKPILLSTGMATLAEIENAIQTIEKEGNNNIVILHCISIYPPAYEDINLKNIAMLKQTFNYPVGFSDHTIGTSISLASVVFGSCVIEKHFTLDENLPGWDHEISADPEELKEIVIESKKIVKSLGSYKRIVSNSENEKKNKFRRSIVTLRKLEKGEVIKLSDLTFKRPGTQIAPDELKYVLGRKINKSIDKDVVLKWEDLI